MKIVFAPLEGITGSVFRNTFHEFFPEVDEYFAPFIATNQKGNLGERNRIELGVQDTKSDTTVSLQKIYPVPQLMSKCAPDFIVMSETLSSLGFREVNLNAGCPSPTVVTKQKGAGMLAQPTELDIFLDKVFSSGIQDRIDISVKTRIGMSDPEELYDLLKIYNQYPLKRLIIHPRTREEYYKGQIHYDIFMYALSHSANPVSYNGDIMTINDYLSLKERFPGLQEVMIGRGFLSNPFLVKQIRYAVHHPDSPVERIPDFMDLGHFFAYHDCLLARYREHLSGNTPVLFKMKELWTYFIHLFLQPPVSVEAVETNQKINKVLKQIRKSKTLNDYVLMIRSFQILLRSSKH
ncbi:MAG: tRNA-dihydrouridine synthase [Lachnospiraceae bacterium]